VCESGGLDRCRALSRAIARFLTSKTSLTDTNLRDPPELQPCGYYGTMTTTGRPREFDDRVTKALRISKELDARLKDEARSRGLSVNVLINAALEDYLDRLLPVEQALRTAS